LLGSQEEELPQDAYSVLINSPWVGAAYETIGDIPLAIAWYELGQYLWRDGKQFAKAKGVPPEIAYRDAAARNQILSAVCSDRIGDKLRARDLYAWTAENRRLTTDELAFAETNKYYHTVWKRLPYRAYALTCLEQWNEALGVAEVTKQWVDRDRRAQTTESYQTPLKILPVILALARYKLHPGDDNRHSAQAMLDPQSIASRIHGDHLAALFYLYNLRARHADLANPPDDELSPAVRARQGADGCKKWMVSAGITLDGTPESLKYLDQNIRSIYQAASDEQEKKAFLFFWGSYFGEVAREELAGGQWNFSKENMLAWTLDWDMGEIELHLWAFQHVYEYATAQTGKTLFQLWQETEQAYINYGLGMKHAD